MEVVAEATTADELLAPVAEHRPDLAVVEIRMPPHGNAGIYAAEQIRDRYDGAVRVLVLSQYLEPDHALRLLRPGVGGVGYLLKDRVADGNQLVDAAERVSRGGSAIDPAVGGELVRAYRGKDAFARLTTGERSVPAHVAEGRSNRWIADGLALSIKTVEGVISSVFAKLDPGPGPDDNRRVLAVLAYLDHQQVDGEPHQQEDR